MEKNNESTIAREMACKFKQLVRSVGIIDEGIWLTRCLDFQRQVCGIVCLYSPPKDLESESEKVVISYKGEKRYVSIEDLVGCHVCRLTGQLRRGYFYLSDLNLAKTIVQRIQENGAIVEVLGLPEYGPMKDIK